MDVRLIKRIAMGLFIMPLMAVMPTIAQNQSEQSFIKHTPLSTEAFEKIPPGKALGLSVAVAKAGNIDKRIRAFVYLDNRVLDVPMMKPTYNQADDLVFSAEVPAPLERMSYQFFVYGADDSKIEVSNRYYLERKCVPVSDDKEAPEQQNGKGQSIEKLLGQNTALERELDLLNNSLNTIKKISNSLN